MGCGWSPQSAGEQLRACVWSESAGRARSVPALLASNLPAWRGVGKSPAVEQGLLASKKQPPPSAIPPSPTPSPCSLGQILPYCKVCLSRGGGGEVIWTHCLLFNYQQSSWAWLSVWCCCFLRLLMKACLELDEEQFCFKMLKVITFFFNVF